MALLEGVGVGVSGGDGGLGREWVGSWSFGNRLRWGAGGARGHPAAGCSDSGKCLENCGLRCFYDTVLLEPWRKMELIMLQ